jgi:hypothetical protein
MNPTLHSLNKMTDKELEDAISICVIGAPQTSQIDRLAILLESQVYRTELYRRADDKAQIERDRVETKRWRTDLFNEFIIIVMIGIEIILSIYGIRLTIDAEKGQSADAQKLLVKFGEMETDLKAVQKSADATAQAMTTLTANIEIMNKTLQQQLGLNYEVLLQSSLDQAGIALKVTNFTKTTVLFCGIRKNKDREPLSPHEHPILPGETMSLDLRPLLPPLSEFGPGPGGLVADLELYFKNERGEKYVGRLRWLVNGFEAKGGMGATLIVVTREKW